MPWLVVPTTHRETLSLLSLSLGALSSAYFQTLAGRVTVVAVVVVVMIMNIVIIVITTASNIATK